ncbi:hypothetical protein JQ506_11830 [Shinella sp. PSBB067]|uniref:hypothetical protein n=1 Tax=Shinella sp. PSBB067 TaxID=2715959 RepID=UPI00193C2DDD|nr:hypothetical protein [Shinella sp. PSBB067]QRI65611.1 hypothetical protein JQ506_11830 [Shinella sp. PSBB067]
MLMPTTHYDWIKRMRPDFVEAIAQSVRSVEPRRYGLVRDDLDDEFFHRVSRQSVDAHFRATIRAAGHRPEEFSPDELLSMLPPGDANKLFTTLEFEWQFFSNFELFGKKSFFFSPNITQKLADTELNVASESVATPFPCCLFAYDNQAARDAYFAMIGLGCPSFMATLFAQTYVATAPCLLRGMRRPAQMNVATVLENSGFSICLCSNVCGERHLA